MGDYRDEHNAQSEEELGHLEDSDRDVGREAERDRPRGRFADPRELPRPLYRIKASHSNETFYAYFPPATASKAGSSREQGATPDEQGEVEASAAPAELAGESAEAEIESAESASESALAVEGAPASAEGGAEAEPPLVGAPVPPTEESDDYPLTPAEAAAAVYIAPRTMVVVPTRYGRDVCELQGVVVVPGQIGKDEIVPIERIATADDLRKVEANRERERKAFETCKQKIAARNLPMKLVSAHYLLEEPKVLFYFSAESRVDFRELVKDLVSVFKIRIELRQIGVRDEARVTGGCGVCGRVLCCHGVTDKLVPVSIKMAKDQNLSLNSMKISGPCGRLLCCLAYEYGFYRDARRELPNEGARFQYDGVQFRVIEVNALSGSVKMAGEDGRLLDMPASRFTHAEGRWQVKPEPAEAKDDDKEKA
jgi:cell fate regulator YaaT (PSP1 superfamily)